MKEPCLINVCGLYPNGGAYHSLEGFWYGHIVKGKMIVSISETSAYDRFSERWMPNDNTKGIVVSAPMLLT